MILFKNRKIDYTRAGLLYRNLNRKETTFSFEQDGLVRAHLHAGDSFRVYGTKIQKGGLQRYRDTGIRNVHAFLIVEVDEHPQEHALTYGNITYKDGFFRYEADWLFERFVLENLNWGFTVRITSRGLKFQVLTMYSHLSEEEQLSLHHHQTQQQHEQDRSEKESSGPSGAGESGKADQRSHQGTPG